MLPEELQDGADAPAIEEARPDDLHSAVQEAFNRAKEATETGNEPAEPKEGRQRDATGRFARKDGEAVEKPEPVKDAPVEGEPAIEEPKEPGDTLVLRPPGSRSWSAAAREQFARLPPEVQESVARREVEINRGFAVLADYKGLEAHTPMLKAAGLTHAEFTQRAVDWERALQTNPVGTVLHVAKLANVDLAKLVASQGGAQPAPPPRAQPQPAPQDIERLIDQRVSMREANSSVQAFLDDPANVHAEAVIGPMTAIIEQLKVSEPHLSQSQKLSKAYDMACWADPSIRAELIKQQRISQPSNGITSQQRSAADQARRAAKATTGAPLSLNPGARAPDPGNTVGSAARAAYQMQIDA